MSHDCPAVAVKDHLFLPTLVLSEHFLPKFGGSITWLVQTYSRYRYSEVIVVAGEHGDTMMVDQALPFKVKRIRMSMTDWDPTRPASLWRYVAIFLKVRQILRDNELSQIHCIKVLPEGLVAWCVWRLTGVPYLVYAHGEEIQMRLTSRKLGWLIPLLYRNAAAIIANSHHTAQLLIEIGVKRNRIHVIHPGVDGSVFRADEAEGRAVRQRHNLDHAFVLLTVGRLQRRKGQDMVIKALPLIKEQISNAAYMIVGTGEDQAYLHDLAEELGVLNDVVFVGSIPDDHRAAYYNACDVFVMPNREVNADIEGFGMVFLEAAAAGKPVIGGLSGGTAEAIEEDITGLRVDGESTQAITDAVVALAKNIKKAQAMGEQGRQRVVTNFSWEFVVQRTRQITTNIAVSAC